MILPRTYKHRKIGDKVGKYNGELLESINGKLWKIKCECGNTFISQPSSTSGHCVDCGRRIAKQSIKKHGEAPSINKEASRLYRIWLGMFTRCYNPKNHAYKHYGQRGISVCNEWKDYLKFKDWAILNGYSDELSIERIDVNGNYEPANCNWVTIKEQAINRRSNKMLAYNGETKPLCVWCRELNLPYHTIKQRINKYGYSIKDAFEKPIHKPELNDYARGEER